MQSSLRFTEGHSSLVISTGAGRCAATGPACYAWDCIWAAAAPKATPPTATHINSPHATPPHPQNGVSFHDTRERLLPRPWVVDCLDPLLDRLSSHVYRKALLFVDNSGADVILGEWAGGAGGWAGGVGGWVGGLAGGSVGGWVGRRLPC